MSGPELTFARIFVANVAITASANLLLGFVYRSVLVVLEGFLGTILSHVRQIYVILCAYQDDIVVVLESCRCLLLLTGIRESFDNFDFIIIRNKCIVIRLPFLGRTTRSVGHIRQELLADDGSMFDWRHSLFFVVRFRQVNPFRSGGYGCKTILR
eukprot:scaffold3255_cov158-Amphora_coffeaeformis.AAC.6